MDLCDQGRAVIIIELRTPALEMVGMLPSAVGPPESFLRRLHAVSPYMKADSSFMLPLVQGNGVVAAVDIRNDAIICLGFLQPHPWAR